MYENTELKREMKLVVFRLADEEFGAAIQQVHEIIRLVEVTRVPRAPRFIEGVINLRGRVIPILDLRRRFDLPMNAPTAQQRIMEVEVEGQIIGMVVDAVSEVVSIPVDAIEPPPPMIADIAGKYITGIAKISDRILILLDFNQILSNQEAQQIEQTTLEGLPGMAGELPSTSIQEERNASQDSHRG